MSAVLAIASIGFPRRSGERPKARCVGITFSVSLLVSRVGRVAKKSSCELLARLSRDKSRDLAGMPRHQVMAEIKTGYGDKGRQSQFSEDLLDGQSPDLLPQALFCRLQISRRIILDLYYITISLSIEQTFRDGNYLNSIMSFSEYSPPLPRGRIVTEAQSEI